jgi:hypothetical protein
MGREVVVAKELPLKVFEYFVEAASVYPPFSCQLLASR